MVNLLDVRLSNVSHNRAGPAAPPIIAQPDDKDWTWVLDRPCPECGFDASTVDRESIAERLLAATPRWESALRREGATTRPAPQTWSVLEYGCHTRDVHLIFGERARLIMAEQDPRFANWNQDETAITERYCAADPARFPNRSGPRPSTPPPLSPDCPTRTGPGPGAGAMDRCSPCKLSACITFTTSSTTCTTSVHEPTAADS